MSFREDTRNLIDFNPSLGHSDCFQDSRKHSDTGTSLKGVFMHEIDDEFYERADAHIHLANDQISEKTGMGKVSASNMYATARFNAWVSASGWHNGKEMAEAKQETLDYFVNEYRKMLDENLDDYIENFESYMRPGE